MLKKLLPLLLGALVGVVLVLYEDETSRGGEVSSGASAAFDPPTEASVEASTDGAARDGTSVVSGPGSPIDRASIDPAAAVRDALELDLESERRSALARVALYAADVDPVAALAAAAQIKSFDLRDAYRAAVYTAWGRRDSAAMLEFVAANPLETFPDQRFFTGAAEADVAFLIEGLRRIPASSTRSAAMRAVVAALEELALESPAAAIRAVGDSATYRNRVVELAAVARGYGRNDPQGALAWLRSLPLPSTPISAAALEGIAVVDPVTAAAALVEELLRVERIDT